MKILLRFVKTGIIFAVILIFLSVIVAGGLYLYLNPQLPSIAGLSDIRLQVPLRIYSSDGSLMGEFGEKRRTPKSLDEIPPRLQQAFLAAEDDRFYEHPGVDWQGILRAGLNLLMTGERGQGGSTITMQLARNFYLSSEKTYIRKINEIFLALKIERELSKEKILELYLNKIYLGHRSYGVGAAAQVYYGVGLEDLTLAQIAMIAGLPKAPSNYNPVTNPERAVARRNYVLGRMRELGLIDQAEYEASSAEEVSAELRHGSVEVDAPYVNEMVRAEIVRQFGDEAYNRGLNVITTISDRLQEAVNESIWSGLVEYDRRHGYRGPVRHVDLRYAEDEETLAPDQHLAIEHEHDLGRFRPALVTGFDTIKLELPAKDGEEPSVNSEERAKFVLRDGTDGYIGMQGLAWARKYISVNRVGPEPEHPSDVLEPGDVIRVFQNKKGEWELGQVPEVQGALVSITPNDGAIRGLSGGFNFHTSKFNRAVQARRQAGSSFKPFIYSAALAKSYTPATLVNDAPVVFEDDALEASWRPENYSGKFHGPTRLREALYKSRNLVSIRILNSIGLGYTTRFVSKFGFDSSSLRRDLSLALGSAEVSPLELARGFAVFANGGYLVEPYLIERIEDADGRTLFEADAIVACTSCVLAERRHNESRENRVEEEGLPSLPKQAERTLEPRIAYQMNSILQDVIKKGTGRRALQLGRSDIAGKTGTTNDQRDAWFNGYNPDLVAVAWVGFDQLKPLGARETGSSAALPMWIDFMRIALAGRPERQLPRPQGLITAKINPETGELASNIDENAVFEIFRVENAPDPEEGGAMEVPVDPDGGEAPIPEQLF